MKKKKTINTNHGLDLDFTSKLKIKFIYIAKPNNL